MRHYRFLLAFVVPMTCVLPASAGIFFGKHAKTNPAERVPQLIAIVKTDTDESKRESAARELREYDPAAYPDVVSVLIDVLQHDDKPSVRSEAALSLGKLRPVSQVVGWALEEATKDPSFRVRMQARSALLGYRLSGYRSEPQVTETPVTNPPKETAPKTSTWSLNVLKRTPTPTVPTKGSAAPGETAPPPLADPITMPALRPVPKAGSQPSLTPSMVPNLQKPATQSSEAGPDLPPQ